MKMSTEFTTFSFISVLFQKMSNFNFNMIIGMLHWQIKTSSATMFLMKRLYKVYATFDSVPSDSQSVTSVHVFVPINGFQATTSEKDFTTV